MRGRRRKGEERPGGECRLGGRLRVKSQVYVGALLLLELNISISGLCVLSRVFKSLVLISSLVQAHCQELVPGRLSFKIIFLPSIWPIFTFYLADFHNSFFLNVSQI